MNAIARSALRTIITRITWIRASGVSATSRVIRDLMRLHDRILRRWPDAYSD